jgi:ABC-type transport system involved in multi-copper enzyme maturation permease subunit
MVAGRTVLGPQVRFYPHARQIVWVFWIIALLRLAVLAGGAIAREKEGGTLSLLLTIPLDERRIVRGKVRAVVHRGLPWIVAAVVVDIGYIVSWISLDPLPQALGLVCYLATAMVSAFFVATAGIYFGARLKTTAAAVVTTLGIHLFLRHVVGGLYNPIYVWLRYKAIMASRGSGMATMVFGFGTLLVVMLLEVGLGLFLLRRTPGILRRYA